jgi:hypothetical protein
LLPASLLGGEKFGVGAAYELIERLVRLEPSQAHTYPDPSMALDRTTDNVEAARCNIMVNAAESAHELVTAVPNDRIEGTQIRSQRPYEYPQHVVAGGVPIPVVYAFHPVDIHEGDNEAPIGSPCTVDLMAKLEPAYLATEGSG